MPTFWAGKAELIELPFWCHMPATIGHSKCEVNATRYATRIATTTRRGKVLIFKPKDPGFHTTEFSYINLLP